MQSKKELHDRKAEQRAQAMRESLMKRKAQVKERTKKEKEDRKNEHADH